MNAAQTRTMTFSAHRWVKWCNRGRRIPAGMRLFCVHASDHDRAFNIGEGLADSFRVASLGIKDGEPSPRLLWVILATSWTNAMIRYYELQGWGIYRPFEGEDDL